MRSYLSKRKLNAIGLDKNGVFKNNEDISIINVADALAFETKLLHAGYNSVPDFSVYKLKRLYLKTFKVSLHCHTIRNYIHTLSLFNQIEIDDHNTLRFLTLRSKTKARNFIIDFDPNDSIKSIGREIAKHIFSSSMRVIGYCLDTISTLTNPKNLSAFKQAEKRSRKLGFNIDDFKDNGISYETLANRFNTSKQTVSALIKKCCNEGIFTKVKHVTETVIKHAKKVVGAISRFIGAISDDVTYFYYNENVDTLRLYKVSANTYVYNPYQREELNYRVSRKNNK